VATRKGSSKNEAIQVGCREKKSNIVSFPSNSEEGFLVCGSHTVSIRGTNSDQNTLKKKIMSGKGTEGDRTGTSRGAKFFCGEGGERKRKRPKGNLFSSRSSPFDGDPGKKASSKGNLTSRTLGKVGSEERQKEQGPRADSGPSRAAPSGSTKFKKSSPGQTI